MSGITPYPTFYWGQRQHYILLGSTVALGIISFNEFILERGFLEKISPVLPMSFGPLETMLSLFCAVAALCFALALAPRNPMPAIRSAAAEWGYRIYAFSMIAVLVATVVLTAVFPDLFLAQVKELKVISLSQELLLVAAIAVLFFTASRASSKTRTNILGVPGYLIVTAMALAVTLLFLEEISYGQHLFGWPTPDQFSGNLQNESNFHNFYTNRFEFLYYNLALLAFVILPIMTASTTENRPESVYFYIPSQRFALYSLPTAGLFYESWTIIAYRIEWIFAFFLFALLINNITSREKATVKLLFIAYSCCSVLVLILGENLRDGYEVEEMRELAICLSVFAYAIWLCAKVRTHDGHRVAQDDPAQSRSWLGKTEPAQSASWSGGSSG